ncbi:RDD family protein [Haloprofundus halobius]|uniref:RDD family protein n=1 Tax=Haloprofundus halobius TaxID=2876194 RepID=UPI001CCC67F0|nr:RDD family protein [Haloprofundus halobius]
MTSKSTNELDLRLFGAIHADRRGKVADELDEFAEGVDALFVEYPVDGIEIRDVAAMLLRVPIAGLSILLMTLVHFPLYALCQRHRLPAEALAVREKSDAWNVPVYSVDDHPVTIMAEADWGWTLPNWVGLVALAALMPGATVTVTSALVFSWLLLTVVGRHATRLFVPFGVVVPPALLVLLVQFASLPYLVVVLVVALTLLFVVYGTLDYRNEVMLDRVESISAEHGYGDICLVTGKAHLSGLLEAGEETTLDVSRMHTSNWLRTSSNTVENPKPTDEEETTPPDGALGTERDVLGARVGAALVDVVVTVVLGAVGFLLIGLAGVVLFARPTARAVLLWGFLVAPASAAVLYGATTEYRYGRTLGKRLTGLVVVGSDGDRCTRRSAVLRNALRPVDFAFCYGLGFVAMLVTERRQRLGDLVADTVIVRAAAADTEADADRPPTGDDAGAMEGREDTDTETKARSWVR